MPALLEPRGAQVPRTVALLQWHMCLSLHAAMHELSYPHAQSQRKHAASRATDHRSRLTLGARDFEALLHALEAPWQPNWALADGLKSAVTSRARSDRPSVHTTPIRLIRVKNQSQIKGAAWSRR